MHIRIVEVHGGSKVTDLLVIFCFKRLVMTVLSDSADNHVVKDAELLLHVIDRLCACLSIHRTLHLCTIHVSDIYDTLAFKCLYVYDIWFCCFVCQLICQFLQYIFILFKHLVMTVLSDSAENHGVKDAELLLHVIGRLCYCT